MLTIAQSNFVEHLVIQMRAILLYFLKMNNVVFDDPLSSQIQNIVCCMAELNAAISCQNEMKIIHFLEWRFNLPASHLQSDVGLQWL